MVERDLLVETELRDDAFNVLAKRAAPRGEHKAGARLLADHTGERAYEYVEICVRPEVPERQDYESIRREPEPPAEVFLGLLRAERSEVHVPVDAVQPLRIRAEVDAGVLERARVDDKRVGGTDRFPRGNSARSARARGYERVCAPRADDERACSHARGERSERKQVVPVDDIRSKLAAETAECGHDTCPANDGNPHDRIEVSEDVALNTGRNLMLSAGLRRSHVHFVPG